MQPISIAQEYRDQIKTIITINHPMNNHPELTEERKQYTRDYINNYNIQNDTTSDKLTIRQKDTILYIDNMISKWTPYTEGDIIFEY